MSVKITSQGTPLAYVERRTCIGSVPWWELKLDRNATLGQLAHFINSHLMTGFEHKNIMTRQAAAALSAAAAHPRLIYTTSGRLPPTWAVVLTGLREL